MGMHLDTSCGLKWLVVAASAAWTPAVAQTPSPATRPVTTRPAETRPVQRYTAPGPAFRGIGFAAGALAITSPGVTGAGRELSSASVSPRGVLATGTSAMGLSSQPQLLGASATARGFNDGPARASNFASPANIFRPTRSPASGPGGAFETLIRAGFGSALAGRGR